MANKPRLCPPSVPPVPPPEIPADLVDGPTAARLAKATGQSLRRWRNAGRIRGWRRCGRWYYSAGEIRGLFVEGERPQPPPRLPPAKRKEAAWVTETLAQFGM